MAKLAMWLGACLSLAACGSNLPRPESFDATNQKITTVSARDAARAYLIEASSCPYGAREQGRRTIALAPVIAAAIPFAVDLGVRAIGDSLKRAQSELTAEYLATGTGSLSSGCLIIARGRFGLMPEGLPKESGILTTVHLKTLGLAAYPSLYMEAEVSGGPEQFQIMPRALQFGKTAALRRGDGRKSLGMVIVLRAEPLDKADKESAVKDATAIIPFDFGPVQEGTAILGADKTPKDIFADQRRAVTVKGKPGALNIYGYVVEAGEADRVLTLVSEAFDGNKDNLKKALADAIADAVKDKDK